MAARGVKNGSGLLQPTAHRARPAEPGSAFSFPHLALWAFAVLLSELFLEEPVTATGEMVLLSVGKGKGLFLRWCCQHLLLGKVHAGAPCI